MIHTALLAIGVFNALFPALDPLTTFLYWEERNLPGWAEFCVRWQELDYVTVVLCGLGFLAIWGAWLKVKRDSRANVVLGLYVAAFWVAVVIEILIGLVFFGIFWGLDPRTSNWLSLIWAGLSRVYSEFRFLGELGIYSITGIVVSIVLLVEHMKRRRASAADE